MKSYVQCPNLSEGAHSVSGQMCGGSDSVSGQMCGGEECPLSGVTNSGRVCRNGSGKRGLGCDSSHEYPHCTYVLSKAGFNGNNVSQTKQADKSLGVERNRCAS